MKFKNISSKELMVSIPDGDSAPRWKDVQPSETIELPEEIGKLYANLVEEEVCYAVKKPFESKAATKKVETKTFVTKPKRKSLFR